MTIQIFFYLRELEFWQWSSRQRWLYSTHADTITLGTPRSCSRIEALVHTLLFLSITDFEFLWYTTLLAQCHPDKIGQLEHIFLWSRRFAVWISIWDLLKELNYFLNSNYILSETSSIDWTWLIELWCHLHGDHHSHDHQSRFMD